MNNSSVRSFVPDLRPDKTIGRNLNCRKRRLDWSFIHIRKRKTYKNVKFFKSAKSFLGNSTPAANLLMGKA